MIKVFKVSDLIKYVLTVIVPLILILFVIKLFLKDNQKMEDVGKKANFKIMDDSIELLQASKKNEDYDDFKIKEWGNTILNSEYSILNSQENIVKNETKQEEESKQKEVAENKEEVNEIKQADTNVQTEVVENNVNPKYNREYNGVKINNSTDYELTDDLLNTDGLNINKSKALIYHTHTCESYTPSELYNYEETGTFRTTDLNYSVAKVGDELETQLGSYGWSIIHNKTYHDYPSYSGSYSRSLKTAEEIINNNNQDVDISIDLHRDAIGDSNYAPKVKIGDEYVSQLMFVIGTDGSNPNHTNWNQNLKFAIKVQQKANELYPGLFKPIILRNSEYNQHISKAACIIEVGATGNTLEESIGAMKYLAKVLQEI